MQEFKFQTIPQMVEAFTYVNSWDSFSDWFAALPTFFQWFIGAGMAGLVIAIYIFIMGWLKDNEL